MQFLFPQFLWALTALAIPIVIHLFYFRRYKRVLFSNVRFLREIKEETSARNKLRNLLILLMRCLALAALVFAFAQPFIPVSDKISAGIRHVSVFIDNSFSMQSFGEDLPLLDHAKQRARDIVNAYGQEDKFQILTHDLAASQQRFMNQDEAMGMIEETEITPSVSPLSRVLNRQQSLIDREAAENGVSYLISDFQKSITEGTTVDSGQQVNLVVVQAVRQENVTIDSAWLDTPVQILNQTSPLIVHITNHGTSDVENVKLTMALDGQEKPVSSLTIPAGESVTDTAQITILKTGWHEITLRITDFPVTFDDTWYMTFYVDEEIKVLALNGSLPNPRLVAAFDGSQHYKLTNQSASQVNFSEVPNYDLVILNELESITSGMSEALFQYMTVGGGRVLLFPDADRPASAYQGFLARSNANPYVAYQQGEKQVGYINTEEFIFNDVFLQSKSSLRLPVTQASYTTSDLQRSGREKILGFRDGTSFLDKYRVGNGILLVCTAPLSEEVSDLSRNAEIFIPLLYKAAIATQQTRPNAYLIGHENLIEVDASGLSEERVFTMKGNIEFIPGMTPMGSKVLLSPGDQVREAGFYQLLAEEKVVGSYGFNYDRKESRLECFTTEELTTLFGPSVPVLQASAKSDFTQLVQEREKGIQLWKWCIVLALLFLLLEIVAIRLIR